MNARRWLILIAAVVVVGSAAAWHWLPALVRHVAVSQIQAITHRTASIEELEVHPVTGRFVVRGFRLTEPDGHTPFAEFRELELRIRLLSLLAGHLWIRDLVLSDSTVRVVRLAPDRFNISDLIQGSDTRGKSRDVTVERFELAGGTVTLEDRALPDPRTWSSERITISARNLSTRRDDGTAVGTSVTAGAPVRIDIRDLRLHPIHGKATVTVDGLDLTLARAYLPPDAPVVLERGRLTTSLAIALDAREGLRIDGTGNLEEVTVARRDGGERLALVPRLTTQIRGFAVRDGALRLEQFSAEGAMSVRDPTGRQADAFRLDTVKATVADLTWPATTPGRVDIRTSIPGGGTLTVAGMVRPPPAPSDLRLRLASLDLAPWAWLLPVTASVTGLAEADLRVTEPLGAGIPTRVRGAIAVNRPGIADGPRHLLGARRIEATGLELHGPSRLVVKTVTLREPRAVVERDRDGDFPARRLIAGRATPGSNATRADTTTPLEVEIGEVVVRGGAVAWRDHAVAPSARLDLSNVDARLTGMGWPLREAAGVRVSLTPPGGGELQVTGRVGLHEPMNAALRIIARNADLGSYQAYVPTAARITGAADADLAVEVPSLAEPRATARGTLAVSRVDVQDRQRTVLRVERATASGVDVDWPQRITIGRLALAQPWAVLERDDKGAFPLRTLLLPATGTRTNGATTPEEPRADGLAIAVGDVRVEGGGMRLVDRAVSPAFAVDVQPVTLHVEGLTTLPDAKPARVHLSGQLGPGADLVLRGTIGAIGAPLRLDVNGELREFAVPRTNPYLLQQIGWKTIEGRLTTKLRCRIDGDALSARTEIRLSRLELLKAAAEDGAQARLGLPLRMLTSLLKDKRGDITLAFPIGGSVTDPRFDFSEAMWSAIRTVAINAITLPVSWIGRVHFTPDSRIERVEIDPIRFEPGASTLTAAGRAQVARLAAFFDQLPEVRMTATPVVSGLDALELKRRFVDQAVDRLAHEGRLSTADAASRLYETRFPGRPAPATLPATLAALMENEALPASALDELAERRVEAVRTELRQAGIDHERLPKQNAVEADGSRIDLQVVEPDAPRPSRTREILRRIGVPGQERR